MVVRSLELLLLPARPHTGIHLRLARLPRLHDAASVPGMWLGRRALARWLVDDNFLLGV